MRHDGQHGDQHVAPPAGGTRDGHHRVAAPTRGWPRGSPARRVGGPGAAERRRRRRRRPQGRATRPGVRPSILGRSRQPVGAGSGPRALATTVAGAPVGLHDSALRRGRRGATPHPATRPHPGYRRTDGGSGSPPARARVRRSRGEGRGRGGHGPAPPTTEGVDRPPGGDGRRTIPTPGPPPPRSGRSSGARDRPPRCGRGAGERRTPRPPCDVGPRSSPPRSAPPSRARGCSRSSPIAIRRSRRPRPGPWARWPGTPSRRLWCRPSRPWREATPKPS